MNTVLVDKSILQRLLDYVAPEESRDFEECAAMDWTEEELSNHAYTLIQQLQDSINSQ
jgi:hypothetical protein